MSNGSTTKPWAVREYVGKMVATFVKGKSKIGTSGPSGARELQRWGSGWI